MVKYLWLTSTRYAFITSSDVFPLDKIYHLWDKLLFGPSSLPLFVGIAILRQIRDTLLNSDINGCFVLFSESFPEVDIEKCMQNALSMCKVTPPSITYRVHDPNSLGGPDSHVNPNEKRVENNHDWKVLDVEIAGKGRQDGHDGVDDEGEVSFVIKYFQFKHQLMSK